jgi:hypothetical protein
MLLPISTAPTKTVKNAANKTVFCGYIEPALWAKQKKGSLPWTLIDGFSPFDPNDNPKEIPVMFFACRAHYSCQQVWEVPLAGINSIQSNILKHVKNHFSYNPKMIGEVENDEEGTVKPAATQYEFVARYLATGLPHYQVTRDSPSGFYHFLKKQTNCPVSSKATFDEHLNTFLERSTAAMFAALIRNLVFILGDSTPDKLKREWINFGLAFIDYLTGKFFYMPLGLNQAKGRLHQDAYEAHVEKLLQAWGIIQYDPN